MKKTLLLLVVCLAVSLQMWGWGGVGHAVIAEVASQHLTPKAKAQVEKYLNGKTMPDVASYPDKYRGVWTIDLGFVPNNPDVPRAKWIKDFDFNTPLNIAPVSHVVTVDKKFKAVKGFEENGRYFANLTPTLEEYISDLKNAEQMDAEKRFRELCFIIHLVGDLHNPNHVRYIPNDSLCGGYNIIYKGKDNVRYHGFWDSQLISENPLYADVTAFARSIDTANEKEIKKITKGNLHTWISKSAKDTWPAHKYQKGMTLTPEAADAELKPLAYSQMRNAGYRLAALLNSIFK